MNNIELKPCPFCGGKARLIKQDGGDTDDAMYVIECENDLCRAGIDFFDTEEECVKAWNNRKENTASVIYGRVYYLDLNHKEKVIDPTIVCGNCFNEVYSSIKKYNYCPNCGAKLIWK